MHEFLSDCHVLEITGLSNMQLLVLFAFLASLQVKAFSVFPRSGALVNQAVVSVRSNVMQAKPDLFSDDLFEDDEEEKRAKASKKNYLEEDWRLNPADEVERSERERRVKRVADKSFLSEEKKVAGKDGAKNEVKKVVTKELFTKNGEVKWDVFWDEYMVDVEDTVETGFGTLKLETLDNVRKFPCWALIYHFFPEHHEDDFTEVEILHKEVCANYKRIMTTELLNSEKLGRGAVILWTGLTDSPEEHDIIEQEMERFMSQDPYVTQEYVAQWSALNLDPDEFPDEEEDQEASETGAKAAEGADVKSNA